MIQNLPAINASLNAVTTILLVCGALAVHKKNIVLHQRFMLAAFGVSSLFLISYLYYHARVGSVRFTGNGLIRIIYFTILISHTFLATVIVPMILTLLYWAWKQKFGKHAALARWTLPLWLYVSVSGVAVYWMLYRL